MCKMWASCRFTFSLVQVIRTKFVQRSPSLHLKSRVLKTKNKKKPHRPGNDSDSQNPTSAGYPISRKRYLPNPQLWMSFHALITSSCSFRGEDTARWSTRRPARLHYEWLAHLPNIPHLLIVDLSMQPETQKKKKNRRQQATDKHLLAAVLLREWKHRHIYLRLLWTTVQVTVSLQITCSWTRTTVFALAWEQESV